MHRISISQAVIIFSLTAGFLMSSANSSSAQSRSLDTIRSQGNHLVDQPSLYLRQHAYNPIDWYPWGDEALQRSRDDNKPIFLSIGYSSCHWCHVMEHEVFEKDDVASYLNQHFICIKVDREERPDLDAVYMEAVQMLTGRGGWPMSVFLTPELKPFYGGTYFPKDHFLGLIGKIEEVYRTHPEEVAAQANDLADKITQGSRALLSEGEGFKKAMIQAAVDRAAESYDPQNGGFRQTQKFPTPVKWRFLLHEYRFSGKSELGDMILHTCQAMAQGGLYDHVGGGFHRYTVDVDWTVPHFEKMLYDNGQLASLMLEAGVVFNRVDLKNTGLDVLDFLLREMRDEKGGIFASYDADSGGEEGTYYVWNQEEITAVVGAQDGPALAALLGVTEKGNFEHTGRSVLTRRADMAAVAQSTGRSADELEGLFARHRDALRSFRDQRTPPGLDRKIVTSWNGLAITALAQGYAVSGQERYLEAARAAADFLLTTHRRADGSLWRSSSEGQMSGEGILDDYTILAEGLVELYQVSGEAKYLAAARQLVDHALEHFDRPEGGYYMTPADGEAPLGRRVDYFDSVVPSGSGVLVHTLLKLSALTGETSYRDRATANLDQVSDLLDRAGPEMAWWFDAARKMSGPFYDVVIAGDDDAMVGAVLELLPASAVVSRVPGAGASQELVEVAPALQGKTAVNGKPTGYVCRFGSCQAPTGDGRELVKQVLTGWKR
jgi:hypothetical protein